MDSLTDIAINKLTFTSAFAVLSVDLLNIGVADSPKLMCCSSCKDKAKIEGWFLISPSEGQVNSLFPYEYLCFYYYSSVCRHVVQCTFYRHNHWLCAYCTHSRCNLANASAYTISTLGILLMLELFSFPSISLSFTRQL